MKILIINPNTCQFMTENIHIAALAVANPGTEIETCNPDSGPQSIEGYYDGVYAVPGLLEVIKKKLLNDVDAIVIACFDDTGLDAARCLTEVPVIGICEAACHMASLVAHKIAIVTTLNCSVPILQENVRRYGFTDRCVSISAAEVPVIDLEDSNSEAYRKISAEIVNQIEKNQVQAIILGCGGMSALTKSLAKDHPTISIIDGVSAAVKVAEAAVGLGLKTAKTGGYAAPRPKEFSGIFKKLSMSILQ